VSTAADRIRLDLGYRPRVWQQGLHAARAKARFRVAAVHRRAGKTLAALVELIDGALRATGSLEVFAYVAPYLKQAKAVAWERLMVLCRNLEAAGVVETHVGDMLVRFRANGACIRLHGADNPHALRGLGLSGLVVDEVAQIDPSVWEDVLRPALADKGGWALFIGTPSGINLFSQLFFGASEKPGWAALRYTVFDTDALPADEVEAMQAGGMPENAFAREMLCDFAAASDDQVMSLTDVEVASKRVYKDHDIRYSPIVLGVDPARFGDDRSVIIRRQGLQVFQPLAFREIDNMTLASRVAQEIEHHKPHAVFIDAGAGAGVIDRLRQLGHECVEVPFGGAATNSALYKNKRAEMWFLMAEWVMSGGAIPNDMALKTELATPIYWFDPANRRVLEPKEDTKKRLQGGGSPDLADALALTFAHPVHVRDEYQQLEDRFRVRKTFDPFAKLKGR
jgi:hypothetical protein